jgi:hypothetical protein
MTYKKAYYKLDEAGIVGTEKVVSVARQEYHKRKTAEVFRSEKQGSTTVRKTRKKV